MLSTLFVLLLAASALGQSDGANLDAEWEQWKITYQKEYKGPEEESYRRGIWEETWRLIEAHNKEAAEGKHSYTMGMNQFGDMTAEEVSKKVTGLLVPGNRERSESDDNSKQDTVTPVRD